MNVRPAGDSSFILISFTTIIPLLFPFFPNIFLLLLSNFRYHAPHHLHPKTRSHPFLRSQNTAPASVKPVSATLANTYTHSADCTASPLGPTTVIVRGICTKSVEKMDCPAGQIGLVGVLILDKKGLSPSSRVRQDRQRTLSTASMLAGRYMSAMNVRIRMQRESMRVFSVRSRRLALWAVEVAVRPRRALA